MLHEHKWESDSRGTEFCSVCQIERWEAEMPAYGSEDALAFVLGDEYIKRSFQKWLYDRKR